MKKTTTRLRGAFMIFALLFAFYSKAQTFTKTGPYDTIIATPQTLKLNVSGLQPHAYGTATLTIYYEGDFGASSEYITIYGEHNVLIGRTQPYFDGSDCMADSVTFYFPAFHINNWGTDDTLKFKGMTSNDVDYFCTANHARAKISYNYCAAGPSAGLSIPANNFCTSSPTVAVSARPAGGVLSGAGLTGTTFNPATLTPGTTYTLSYTYTNTAGCITSYEVYVKIDEGVSAVSSNTAIGCAPQQASLTATGKGHIGWYSNAGLTQSVGTGSVFTTPSLTTTTTYYAATTITENYFRIASLETTNSATVDHDALSGDDRGGIAVTTNYVYVCGDDNVARYDLNLQNGISLPKMDGMFSDLGNGNLYSLYNQSLGLPDADNMDSMYVTHLVALTPTLGIGTSTITLSDSIVFGWDSNYDFQSGVFAGNGFVVLYSAPKKSWYTINLQDGMVNNLGALTNPQFYQSENWAAWGVAEFNGAFSVLYRDENNMEIHRRMLPSGTPTTVKAFNDISDMASFTYAPWNNRWYMHYEGSAQFGGIDETLVYADGNDSTGVALSMTINCPAKVTVQVDPCTSIQEKAAASSQVMIMPNPNNGEFSIRVEQMGNVSLEILSIDGRVVYADRLSSNEEHALNLSGLSAGMYVVKISNASEVKTMKMIKH